MLSTIPKKLAIALDPSIETPYSSSDESDEEKHNDPEVSSFNILITAISVADDDYLTLLDSEHYAAYKHVILNGLRLLPEMKDDIDIAAVIFAREHALTVAGAINKLLESNVNFHNSYEDNVTVKNAYLALIDAGADAETIASAIIRHNTKESKRKLIDPVNACFIFINIVKLKKAGIPITDIICNSFTQLFDSIMYNTDTGSEFDSLSELILFLNHAKVFTEHVQLMLCSYAQYTNADDILRLLKFFNKETTLTDSILDDVIKYGKFAWLARDLCAEFVMDGVNLSSDFIITLLPLLDQNRRNSFINGLLTLKKHNMLPNSMLISRQPNLASENESDVSPVNNILPEDQPNLTNENELDVTSVDTTLSPQSEMKPSAVLTESFVIQLIKHPKALAVCDLLISCRGKGELYRYIEQYISLEHLIEMDSILALCDLKLSITPERIKAMCLAILEGTETSPDLILEEQELKKPQKEDLTIDTQTPSSPSPRSPASLNCRSALFHHSSSPEVEQPTGTVELHATVNNSPKTELHEKPPVTLRH